MNAPTWAPLLLRLIAIGIPLSFAVAVPLVSDRRPFRAAIPAAHLALVLAIFTAAGGLVPSGGDAGTLAQLVRLDAITRVMLLLVGFIGVVIVRYSRSYLHGDAGQGRYARALLGTLAAVTVLVLSNNLLVIALAWMATSLALHQLLTFYRDRPQALVVAHKKFLLSRLADACMLGALVLVGTTVGSLDLGVVNAWAEAAGTLPPSMQVAALLLVLAASLKAAQLPFHGWLIQVMEAPTPVSALLHAGVVNIGGFVMIRLAPLMAHAPLAQVVLVVIGTSTAVVAALVMTTRVSIKVALAWSTCAQMGFMLVECGLGAWHLALLHLVAHSLYKAHAFLASGTAVDTWRVRAIVQPREPAPLALTLGASLFVFAGVAATRPPFAPLVIVLGLSLSPLVARAVGGGVRAFVGVVVRVAGVGALYFAAHAAAGRLASFPEPAPLPFAWVVVIGGFSVLFVVQAVLVCRPGGALARALQPRLFAGLYLDELFTRITFRLWPPRLARPEAVMRALRVASAVEARS